MPRNVEIKARIRSVEELLPKAARLASSGPVEILQDDTFFHCESGRLKLRVLPDAAELIFYRRDDERGPKTSFYVRSRIPEPDTLRDALRRAHGERGRVRKLRVLFMAGRTRIHLDRVEGLGDFLELEVVLDDGEKAETGSLEAEALMAKLGIELSDLVHGAYIDLLENKEAGCSPPSRPLHA